MICFSDLKNENFNIYTYLSTLIKEIKWYTSDNPVRIDTNTCVRKVNYFIIFFTDRKSHTALQNKIYFSSNRQLHSLMCIMAVMVIVCLFRHNDKTSPSDKQATMADSSKCDTGKCGGMVMVRQRVKRAACFVSERDRGFWCTVAQRDAFHVHLGN